MTVGSYGIPPGSTQSPLQREKGGSLEVWQFGIFLCEGVTAGALGCLRRIDLDDL